MQCLPCFLHSRNIRSKKRYVCYGLSHQSSVDTNLKDETNSSLCILCQLIEHFNELQLAVDE